MPAPGHSQYSVKEPGPGNGQAHQS
jgi:hypothetical protein